MGSAIPYIKSGKIKALGVTSPARCCTSHCANLRGAGSVRLRGHVLVRPRGTFEVASRSSVRLGKTLSVTLADLSVQSAIRRLGDEPCQAPATIERTHSWRSCPMG